MGTINYTYGIVGANAECETILNARCVAYNGMFLPNINVKDGDDLEQVLLILDNIMEGIHNRYHSGIVIQNLGVGAELYDGYLSGTNNFRSVTTNDSIILTESAEELNLGISSVWLTNYINSFGIQWGATIRLALNVLEQRKNKK